MTSDRNPPPIPTIRRLVVAISLLGLPVILATCRLGELIGTPSVSSMVVIPDSIVEVAALGSSAATRLEFSINNVGKAQSLPWSVDVVLKSSWLTLSLREGSAPSVLTAILNPVGLEAGVYTDTLRITPGSGPDGPVSIPVIYTIEPCRTPLFADGSEIASSVAESDCGAPHRDGSFAKVFSINGLENDSVSVVMFSTSFTPFVALSSGIDPGANVLGESSDCDGHSNTACLRYVVLPSDGTYFVEAATQGAGTIGSFTLAVGTPRTPSPPAGSAQFASDSMNTIQVGSTVPVLDLVFSAMVDDADPGDSLFLELEILPIGTPFSGAPTHTSLAGVSGQNVYTLATGLADNTSYHWQSRTTDETGRSSDWVPFGDNDDGEVDFRVVVAEAPSTPTGLGQFESDQVTPIPVGSTTSEQFVVFKARLFDVDPADQLRLEVEVVEVGTDFTGIPNAVSVPVQSGDTARVAVSGFSDDTQYHWQARAIDQDNNVSLWSSFGGNPETAADFIIFLPGAPSMPGNLAQLRNDTTTVIAIGDTIPDREAIFRATLTDPDPGDSIKLQVEVQPVGTPFTNIPADSSGLVASGQTAIVGIGGLRDDTNFHWQARAVDGSGIASAWTPFGGNTEADVDFRVAVMAVSIGFGTEPPGGIAGEAMAPAVTVEAREASGDVDTGFSAGTVTLGLTAGTGSAGAVLSGTLTRAFVNGVATFPDLNVNLVGAGYTLTATTASIGTATSQPFSINPAAADHLAITTQPSANAASSAPFDQQPAIQLQDVNNNAVNQAGVLVTATIASGEAGATLLTSTASTNASGMALFTGLGINGLVGDYTLTFTAGGVTPVTSTTITLGAGAAANLFVATQPSDTAQSGIAFVRQPAVQVQDAAGNNVASAGNAVTASIATGGGTIGGTTTVTTNAAGLATFTNVSIAGTIGARTLTFASADLTSTTSAPVTLIAGAAANLAIEAGNNQSATAGSQVAIPPSARVTDASGNNVPNAPVTFTVLTGAGTVAPTTPVNSGTNGIAASTSWTLGSAAGSNTLQAATPGTTAVTFTATGTPGAAGQLEIIRQPSANASSGEVFPRQPVIEVQDSFGNPVMQAGTAITAGLASGPGGTLNGSTVIATDATGRATFTNLSLTGPTGAYTLNFSGVGLTGVTSSTVTVGAGSATALQYSVQPTNAAAGGTITPAIQVRAIDASGNPVTTFTGSITLAITPGTGTGGAVLGGTLTQAAVGGVASFANISVNLAGNGYQLNATAAGLTSATSTAFNVTAGVATNLVYSVGPTNRTAGQAFSPSLQIQARDAQGNVDAAYTGSITVGIVTGTGTTGAALMGTVTRAAVAGVATFGGVSVDSVGTGYRLNATAAGLTTGTSGTFDVSPGAPAQLAFTTQPVATAAGATITPAVVVTARDAIGNTATNFSGAVTVSIATGTGTGGAALSGTTIVSAAAGVATFNNLSIDLAGTGYRLQSTAPGLTAATSTAFNITSAAATQLAFTVQPTSTPAASQITPAIQVTARDAQGNTDTGFTGNVVVAITNGTGTGGAVLSGTTSVAAIGGVATFSNLSINLAGSAYTLTATSGALTAGTSAAFNVTASTATQLAFTTQPTTTTAGSGISPAVRVTARDAQGNTVTSFNGAIVIGISPGTGTTGATLSGTLTQNAVAGIATFAGVSIDSAGTGYTLGATSGALTAATSSAFNINAGNPTQLAFTIQPVTTTAGQSIPAPRVTARDAVGNTATSFFGAVTVEITNGTGTTGASLSGTATVGASGGVANFPGLSIDLVGTGYTLTASTTQPGVSNDISAAFNITVGTAATLEYSVQPASPQTAGTNFPAAFSVTARDDQGNVATGFTEMVTVAITNGTGTPNATLSGTTAVAAVSGVATFSGNTVQIDSAGSGYTITATAPTLSSAVSNSLTVNPGNATTLVFTVQPTNTQSAATITPSVVVTARDAVGNRATGFVGSVGVAITGGTGTGGAALTGTTPRNAVAGIATFNDLSIDLAGTGYTLTATATGLASDISNTFNITAGGAASLEFSFQPGTPQTAGTPFSQNVEVTARDGQGNVAAGFTDTVTLSITGGTGTAGANLTGSTAVDAVSGVATFSNLQIDSSGTGYTLTATTPSTPQVVSSALNVDPGSPAFIVFTAQPANTTAGESISPAVVVTARDAVGNTATSFTGPVGLALSGGDAGATLSGTVPQNASAGVATFSNLSVDLVGTAYVLTASASGVPNEASTAFNITAGTAATLEFSLNPGPSQTAGTDFPQVVEVTARDGQGNVASGFTETVTLALTGGTGTTGSALSGTTAVSASAGVATFAANTMQVDSAGTGYTLTATAPTLAAGNSAAFTVNPGAAATLVFTTQPVTTQAGSTIGPPVVVTARDAVGNTATGFVGDVDLALSGGDVAAELSGVRPQTAAAGVATFNDLSVNLVGTAYVLTASAPDLSNGISNSFNITAGPAATLEFSVEPGPLQVAGTPFPQAIDVTARDLEGNVATGFAETVTLAITTNTGTVGALLTGTTAVAPSGGVATFAAMSVQIDSAGTGYTLTASAATLTDGESTAFNVDPGTAATLEFSMQPNMVTAGIAISPAVEVTARDTQGNVATGFTEIVTMTISAGTGTAGAAFTGPSTTGVAAFGGVASFSNLAIDSAGTGYTITASANGPTDGVSTGFTVNAGPAAVLVWTMNPVDTDAGMTIPTVAVTARDNVGNVATGFTDPVTVSITAGTGTGNASLLGTLMQNATSGVASFGDLSIDLPGTAYTLDAAATGLTTVASGQFDITTGVFFMLDAANFHQTGSQTSTREATYLARRARPLRPRRIAGLGITLEQLADIDW